MISISTTSLNNGVQMPRIGFGVFQIPPGEKTYDAVRTALKLGYRAVDTAAAYGNEEDVLYLIHWPAKADFCETWRALERLYKEGQVRADRGEQLPHPSPGNPA
jgi:diketogulonate reductase-like aldo/keto reductase